ncbi:predicted protein [Postia placenta Mad-698-R]|nr:predicted protein [Postia placenta Mad-698-R]
MAPLTQPAADPAQSVATPPGVPRPISAQMTSTAGHFNGPCLVRLPMALVPSPAHARTRPMAYTASVAMLTVSAPAQTRAGGPERACRLRSRLASSERTRSHHFADRPSEDTKDAGDPDGDMMDVPDTCPPHLFRLDSAGEPPICYILLIPGMMICCLRQPRPVYACIIRKDYRNAQKRRVPHAGRLVAAVGTFGNAREKVGTRIPQRRRRASGDARELGVVSVTGEKGRGD